MILVLVGSDYAETNGSIVFPPITGNVLADFVEKSKSTRRTVWPERVRKWARGRTEPAP